MVKGQRAGHGSPSRGRHRHAAPGASRHRSLPNRRPMRKGAALSTSDSDPTAFRHVLVERRALRALALNSSRPAPLPIAVVRLASQAPMAHSIPARSARLTVADPSRRSSLCSRKRSIAASRSGIGRLTDSGSLHVASASTLASLIGLAMKNQARTRKCSAESPGRPICALQTAPDPFHTCCNALPPNPNMLRMPRGSCYAGSMRSWKLRNLEEALAHLCGLMTAG